MPDILVVGAGGHAVSLAETLIASGYSISAFVGHADGSTLLDRPVLPDIPRGSVISGCFVAIAIGDNFQREHAWNEIATWVPVSQIPPIVHPDASVSQLATLEPGSVVLQGAIVGSLARVGVGCLLNSGAILEHESVMGNFSSLAPGATTGGRVFVGARTAISIGAVIKHGITIGADSVVGAASYVSSDIPARAVVYGVPARMIRDRIPGDRYL